MVKNIFITGGAGYIGSHACKAVKQLGYNPIALDNLSTGWKEAVKYGPLEIVDLLDKPSLNKLFSEYNPSAVMHFAAFSQVGESVKKPGKYWANNVVGSLNIIEAATENGCLDFVFSSTCATYGDHDNVLLTESTPQLPVNSYGSSKRATEEILNHFSTSSGLRFVIFRYFNVAGADPDCEIGEYHRPETHLVPLVLDSVLGTKDPITIFGTDYDTPDGTCIRDYVHVCDLADAHLLGLNWLEKGGVNRVYNLGTGHGFSVREVINQTQKVTKLAVPQVEGKRRPGDCQKLVSDSKLAIDELGWSPNRSNLKQIIADAWRWHQSERYSE